MKRTSFIICLLLVNLTVTIHAQDVTGEWEGHLSQDDKSWLFTMHLSLQQTGTHFTGTAKYQSTTGQWVKHALVGDVKKDSVIIRELRVIEEASGGTWMWCIKILRGQLLVNGDKYKLQGNWYNDGKKGYANGKNMENMGYYCPPGYFDIERAVTCTELTQNKFSQAFEQWKQKGRYESTVEWQQRTGPQRLLFQSDKILDNLTPEIRNSSSYTLDYDADREVFTVKPTCFEPFEIKVPRTVAECFETRFDKKWIKTLRLHYNNTTGKIMADTIQVFSACENKMYAYYANKPQREKETVKEPERSTEVKARANDREFAISEVINIPDEEFTVKFYDNGAIDHDTISVFYNGKLVLSKQELTEKSITLHLKLDPSGENVIVMYADNLGEIIPNTAAMLMEDGNFRKTIFMSSTLKKSSAIAVRRKK